MKVNATKTVAVDCKLFPSGIDSEYSVTIFYLLNKIKKFGHN